MNPLEKPLKFLERLETAKIHYRLETVRDAIMVEVFTPGEHWEIEFFADSHVEIEAYRSGAKEEGLEGEEALDRLFATA